MKTGILGGTFNPIHLAHLRIAEEVREHCDLDRVLFLPAATPPHKEVAQAVSFELRLAMVEAAIAGHPGFSACTIEKNHPGKNYSVNTLEQLQQEYPADEFYFIIGLDSFRDLPSWKDYQKLFTLTHLVVATRPGIEAPDPAGLLPIAVQNQFCYSCSLKKWRHRSGKSLIFLQETRLDISSTEIRELVAKGRSIRNLVPPQVADLIEHHGLYRAD
jgi:nicotinate-nucleotide adenylyltransferase